MKRWMICAIALCLEAWGAPVVLRTPKAEFQVSADGYVTAWLLKGRERMTLDAPGAGESRESIQPAVRWAGQEVQRTGKRVEIRSRAAGLERVVVLETLDAFPTMLLSTVRYKNTGSAPLAIEQVGTERHRLNAERMWSFHGASVKWGANDVLELAPGMSKPNVMGVNVGAGQGGGTPVVALWTAKMGIAVGHLDTLPLALSIPVRVSADGVPEIGVSLTPGVTLSPGQSWETPRTFTMVYEGDFYEPLRTYSLALQGRGWKLPKPTDECYNISWCGWGYEFNVTSREMLGVIPKLKEYKIHWATLDDRWFNTYGDWEPRPETFPGDSIRKMVQEYHKNGILVQLWWVPLGVEMVGGKWPSHAYIDANVVKQHPDWLVLGKDGKPVRMIRQLGTLCPALPEVQQYHKQLVEKFIRDWGFDGHKLDNIYSVPLCYNPKHHHKSPYDSVNAMAEVYRIIFETTRALKPNSVTQACPCGTPPNIAWLPYIDQAVTADPVGSQQMRWRTKMYKALLGPRAAVYGDHVELTEVTRKSRRIPDSGDDFASSVGVGAVVGTKFVWPQTDARYKRVALTPEKDREWKHWIEIYESKMLSRGEFRDLYVVGFDRPEGYAIAKDGKMYYAFFAGLPDDSFKGEIELRGLAPGKYRVVDYVHDRELGVVDSRNPRLPAEFTNSLLVEAQKIK